MYLSEAARAIMPPRTIVEQRREYVCNFIGSARVQLYFVTG
jgi:hypothetical protein